ncbi:TonB-dependent receptor [Gammaproteobacteria bacterium AB-CW1]|uniref:TonB-dependent receptor n=1 Tax=Natronospira elongata TaxID=3110268 RepID=A0AAP6MKK2_9GAMM|nr:TonB-dependent receptor [Gammaproteobacteria bacterium AB-CW1]
MTRQVRGSFLGVGVLLASLSHSMVFAEAGGEGDQPLKLDDVVTLGERAGLRSPMESSVPVDIYGGEELRRYSSLGNELGEALANLNSSFLFPRQSNSVTSDHIRSASLRGLSPDQALVLVNGRRRHPSAVVNDNTKIGRGTNAFDFNSIPLSAVKRIEVLRDGASAQYGSDAIGGVINIVLDDSHEGGEVGVSYGVHDTRVSPASTRERDGETISAHVNLGHALGETGFLRYGLEVRSRDATNRAGLDQISPFLPQTDDNLAFQGTQTHRVGDPESDEVKLWVNTGVDTAVGEYHASATFADIETEGAAVFRHPDSNQNVREIFPDGFLPVTLGKNRDFGLSTGIRGVAGAWETDLALSLGRNDFQFGVKNSLNPSLGPDSPTRFDSGRFRLDQRELAFDASRNLPVFAMPSRLSAGASWRHEAFKSRAGEPASWLAGDHEFESELADQVGFPDIGSQGAKGLTPEDAADVSRDVASGYLELSTDFSERLRTTVAARYEDYSDFGGTFTGKFAAVYRPGPNLSFRGSLSNSFRAPTLSQSAWSRSDNTFGPEGERVASRLVRSDSAVGEALGVSELEEETARNISLGFTARLSESLELTADLFRIDIDDRITLSESLQDSPDGDVTLEERIGDLPGGEGVQAVSFFTNAADTKTQGLELMAEWEPEVGLGSLSMDLAFSYIENRIRRTGEAVSEMTEINPDFELVGVAERNTLTTATPERRLIAGGRWQLGAWEFSGRARYNSAVERVFAFASQRFSSETVFDASVGYALSETTRFDFGAENLFDTYPDESENANNFFGNFAFDPINPVGLNGRFVYARLAHSF